MGIPDSTLQILLDSVHVVPREAAADWEEYLRRTVADMWDRPVLSARDRSLVTVAALATLNAPTQLRTHVRLARVHGLSRRELCETVLHVGGYAGLGVATEAMIALREVFAEEPDDDSSDAPSPDHEWLPVEGRHERGGTVIRMLQPEIGDMIFSMTTEYQVDGGADREALRPDGTWHNWLMDTAFGDLWSRPGLTNDERERITTAVLITLGRGEELKPHFRTNFAFGFTIEEVGEAIMQLAPFIGFPTTVEAILAAKQVHEELEARSADDDSR